MIIDALLLALRELRRNLMRASLTTLGVIIGVAAVIAMVTLGNGATVSVTSSIGSLGRNLLILAPGTRRVGGAHAGPEPFAPGDVDAFTPGTPAPPPRTPGAPPATILP